MTPGILMRDYYKEETQVIVDLFINRKEMSIAVPLDRFEQWVIEDGRLETYLDCSDETGAHVQVHYKIHANEYWSLRWAVIIQDLYDYLIKFPTPDLLEEIKSLTYEV